jgi:hypothetical protein
MTTDKRIGSFPDESVGQVFIYLEENKRQCVTCGRIFSRQESFEHSKNICHPPASNAN